MPLVKRTIEPVHICRGEAVASGAAVVRDELQYFNVSSLANVIRQLGSLSAHVDDIFDELSREAVAITRRTMALSERAERLKVKITQLNPTVEEVLLQDINTRKPFKSSIIKDQQVISLATRPFAITEVYRLCDPPPPLQKLNPYRQDGKDSLKFYTEPGYFFELWCQGLQKDAVRNQMRRNKRQRRPPYLPQTIEEDEKVQKDSQKSRSTAEHRVVAKEVNVRSVSSYNKYGCHGEVQNGTIQLRPSSVVNGRTQSRPNSLELQNGIVLPAASLATHTETYLTSTSTMMSVTPPAPPIRAAAFDDGPSKQLADIQSTVPAITCSKSDSVNAAVLSPVCNTTDAGSAAGETVINTNSPALVKHCDSEIASKSPMHVAVNTSSKPQENGRNHFAVTVLPSPPPTPPTVHKQRAADPEALPSPVRSFKSEARSSDGTKSSTPESVVDLPPPPPTPPPQFCQSGSLDSPGSLLPPPPLDDDGCFEVIPPSVSPPPPMSPEPEDLPVFNGKSEVCPVEPSQMLEPTQNTVDGMSIASDVSSATVSSGSTVKSDGITASASAEQPLVRDTRCDLLAAIREGIQLRKVEERRLKTQKHRPVGHLDVQSLMEAAFEMRRKALEENDSDEDDADDPEESGNWSDAD